MAEGMVAEIVSAPKSYREVAQYFDGVSRQAVKGWVIRNQVPEKHWPGLLRICEDYSLAVTESDIRAHARASGQKLSMRQAERALKCDWMSVRRRLLQYAARFTKDNDERLDAVGDAIVAMMNHGQIAPEYGYTCVRNWFLARRQYFREDTECDDAWRIIERINPVNAGQEERLEVIEVVEMIERMPDRYRGLMYLIAQEKDDDELAEYLGVSVRSVSSYKTHARRILRQIISDETPSSPNLDS